MKNVSINMWFVYISGTEECLLEDVLITPKHGLAHQVHDHYLPKLLHYDAENITSEQEIATRNKLFNIDGFGITWYTKAQNDFVKKSFGLRPAIYKSISPPLSDFNFRSICANTATDVVFAHIRATSGSAVTPTNNHPFTFGRYSFMHNGYISDFLSIRRQICSLLDQDAYSNVLGSTDSEHLGALFMTYLTEGRGRASWDETYPATKTKEALERAVAKVIELQQIHLGDKRQPNDLNLATTDGQQLLCIRFRNHATEQPPSLYYSTTAGVTLNRKYPDCADGEDENLGVCRRTDQHGAHLIVASEPTTYKDEEWNLITKNSCITFSKGGELKVEKLAYQKGWDATND
ncbi:N-terminal nucleophile aminohydrolase [Tothia fuscella]|uniref:N-terminal nucleophile aminohydrolase n=1 Tax=Tothia fuscella TaxID=1048955 RepID=A0A9P4NW31_9PEZI|nr:N-terminal nucleophile aminohydrolase [Tothia fuscella]